MNRNSGLHLIVIGLLFGGIGLCMLLTGWTMWHGAPLLLTIGGLFVIAGLGDIFL